MSRVGVDDGRASQRATPAQLLAQRVTLGGVNPDAHGPGWRALSDYYTELAEVLTGDLAISVVAAPKAAGPNPGRFIPALNRIDVDGSILPGAPDLLDLSDAGNFRKLAALHGVFRHEVGHANHTRWTPQRTTQVRAEAVALLEEIRMEGRVVDEAPAAATWLRAAATTLITDGIDELPDNGWGAAHLATLTAGRVLAGSLTDSDVEAFTARLAEVLDERWEPLQQIWRDTLQVTDSDYEAMTAVAQRLVELFPPDEIGGGFSVSVGEGNGQGVGTGGDGPQARGVGAGTGSSLPVGVVADLAELAEQIADDAAQQLEQSSDGEALRDDVESRVNVEVALTVAVPPDFQEDWGAFAAGGAGERAVRWTIRPARADERAARRALTRKLRQASWRDRVVTSRMQALPPGRLRMRAAVQGSADEALGKMDARQPWRRKQRRWVDSPRLRVALLTDVSGSMWRHSQVLSTATWVVGGAVADIGGWSLGVTFGDAATTVFDGVTRKAPEKVLDFLAVANNEAIIEALNLADVGLDFVDNPPRGGWPGVLVVLSDGVWTDSGQVAQADALMQAMRDAGVRIVQVHFGETPYPHPADERVCVRDTDDLVGVLGDALLRVLRGPVALR